jgi:hypothetical protein
VSNIYASTAEAPFRPVEVNTENLACEHCTATRASLRPSGWPAPMTFIATPSLMSHEEALACPCPCHDSYRFICAHDDR